MTPSIHSVEIVTPTLPPTGLEPVTTDLADWLPQRGRATLQAMRQQADELHTVVLSLGGQVSEQRARLLASEQRLRKLQAAASNGGHALADDDATVILARRKVDTERAELQRLTALRDRRSERRQEVGRLVDRCERHLQSTISRTFGSPMHRQGRLLPEHGRRSAPALRKGESTAEALRRIRSQVAELQQAIITTNSAPIPLAARKAKMRAGVAALASQGAPKIGPDGEVTWPKQALRSVVFVRGPAPAEPAPREDDVDARNPWAKAVAEKNARDRAHKEPAAPLPLAGEGGDGFASAETDDAVALFCWLHRDQIIAKLEKEIDAAGGEKDALTDDQRAAQRRRLEAELLATEREEVALIELAGEQGTTVGMVIDHRPGVDVRALLHLDDAA